MVQELRREYAFALSFYQALKAAGYSIPSARLARCDVVVWEIVHRRSGKRLELRYEPNYAVEHRFRLTAANTETREWREVWRLFNASRWYGSHDQEATA